MGSRTFDFSMILATEEECFDTTLLEVDCGTPSHNTLPVAFIVENNLTVNQKYGADIWYTGARL